VSEHLQANLDINLLPPLSNQIMRSHLWPRFSFLLLCYGDFNKSIEAIVSLIWWLWQVNRN
jgi:hypothetical protein